MPRKTKSTEEKEETKEKKEKISNEEFEKLVVELGKKGLGSEKIGEDLRKQGIHPKEFSKKISKILKAHNLYASPDLKNVESKLQAIEKHCEKNKQDKRALRDRERIFSGLRKLKRYFKI